VASKSAKRETVLITGASSGIGRELARVFAAAGCDLVVVARRQAALEELAEEIRQGNGPRVTVVAKDLLAPTAAAELFAYVRESALDVDVLVNNAGVLEVGLFHESEAARLQDLIHLNVAVLTALTRLFLDPMLERGRGRIINVASLAAFQPVPSMAVYAATKAFVLSLSESLSEELRGTGVTVTAVCPGITDTEMVQTARERGAAEVPPLLTMSAAQVARAAFRASRSGRVIEVPGMANEMVANWVRFQPRWLVRAVGGVFGRQFGRRS